MNTLVAAEFVKRYTCEYDQVGDFCCGSGTVSIAALSLLRHAVSFDIDADQVMCTLVSYVMYAFNTNYCLWDTKVNLTVRRVDAFSKDFNWYFLVHIYMYFLVHICISSITIYLYTQQTLS
jgi:predicted RNA methylase